MSDLEQLTVTLPSEITSIVKAVVKDGEYASSSEVVRIALRDWSLRRSIHQHELVALHLDIARGLDDIAAGRISEFDTSTTIMRGRQRSLANRSSSE